MIGPALQPFHDPASLSVRAQLHDDSVAEHDLDIKKSHLPGDMSEYFLPILHLDLEVSVGKGLNDRALFYYLILIQLVPIYNTMKKVKMST